MISQLPPTICCICAQRPVYRQVCLTKEIFTASVHGDKLSIWLVCSGGDGPASTWPIARVEEVVVVSRDGYVRTVRVKTACTVATRAKRRRRRELKTSSVIVTRPITSLCPLEMD